MMIWSLEYLEIGTRLSGAYSMYDQTWKKGIWEVETYNSQLHLQLS